MGNSIHRLPHVSARWSPHSSQSGLWRRSPGRLHCVGEASTDSGEVGVDGHPSARGLCLLSPPKAPYLGNPGSLAELEASFDRPLWVSGRDAEAWFDQLRLPEAMGGRMGSPVVTIAELAVGVYTGAAPFSLDEVNQFLIDAEVGTIVEVTLVSRDWPMGSGWSSRVAQSVMVSACLVAGLARISSSRKRVVLQILTAIREYRHRRQTSLPAGIVSRGPWV